MNENDLICTIGILFIICIGLGICLFVNTEEYGTAQKLYCTKTYQTNVIKFQECINKQFSVELKEDK